MLFHCKLMTCEPNPLFNEGFLGIQYPKLTLILVTKSLAQSLFELCYLCMVTFCKSHRDQAPWTILKVFKFKQNLFKFWV